MTLYEFWENVNYVSGRFPNGGAITPDRLNTIFPLVSGEYYSDCLKRSDEDALMPFRKTRGEGSMPLVTTDGTTSLPDDYYVGAKGYYTLGDDNRPIRFVSDADWVLMLGHAIEYPTEKYPIAKIQGGEIHVRPKSVNHIKFTYLREPTAPYMDYCIDATNPSRVIYMPVGSVVEGGELKQDGAVLSDNVLTRDGSTGTYSSQTVEIEWPEYVHWKLVYLVLQKAGVSLSEQLVMQYAMEKEGGK